MKARRNRLKNRLGIGLAAVLLGSGAAWAQESSNGGQFAALEHADAQWEFLEGYCMQCHNFEDWAGGVAFDTMMPEAVPDDARVWEETVRKLRGRLMPPPGNEQPHAEELWDFVNWMEGYLDEAHAANPRPGRVGLQRLNRREYANAVRELLHVEIDPTGLLPRDDEVHGFDTIADALQVSPAFMEQYVGAARAIAVKAVGEPAPRPGSETYRVRGTQQFHVEGLPLGTRGGALVEHYFPADGEYEINIADMAQALWVYNMEFENTLIVTYNGERIYQTTIGGEEDMRAIDQDQDPAVDKINQRLKNIRFEAEAGPQQVGVTFLRRTFAESDDRLQQFAPGGGQERVLRVNSFQVSGPYDAKGLSETPARRKIFSCYPEEGASADAQRECAHEIFSRLARQAYRRPLNDDDVLELMPYFDEGLERGGFEEGIRAGITGILASPYFLYRAERIPEQLQAGETWRINDLEFASRLAFFLWSTVPDDELVELALDGSLSDPAVREQQVRRMLADPRSQTLATNFAYQWLHLEMLTEVNPDGSIFPYASGANDPRDLYVREIELFVDSVFREDRSVVDLLGADYTYVNEPLALLYGIRNVRGDRFRRVQLEDTTRWGLLGKGAVLMASSYPNRTAPTLRGAYILEHITGTPPAPPPPDVEALQENQAGSRERLTIRELMALHSEEPGCLGCHGVMDALGFALENFDAVGVWRDRDRFAAADIEAWGELPDGTKVEGPDDVRNALLARPDQFVQTLTERLLMYGLGREIDHHDMPVVRQIVRDTADDDWRFSSLILAIVESDPFHTREVPAEDGGILGAAVSSGNR